MKSKFAFAALLGVFLTSTAFAAHPALYLADMTIHLVSTNVSGKERESLTTIVYVCPKSVASKAPKFSEDSEFVRLGQEAIHVSKLEGCAYVQAGILKRDPDGPQDTQFSLVDFYRIGLTSLKVAPQDLAIYIVNHYNVGKKKLTYIGNPLIIPVRNDSKAEWALKILNSDSGQITNSIYATVRHPLKDERFAHINMPFTLRRDAVVRTVFDFPMNQKVTIGDYLRLETLNFTVDSLKEWDSLSKMSSAQLDLKKSGVNDGKAIRNTEQFKKMASSPTGLLLEMYVAVYRKNFADVIFIEEETAQSKGTKATYGLVFDKETTEQEKYYQAQNQRQQMQDFIDVAGVVTQGGAALIQEMLSGLR